VKTLPAALEWVAQHYDPVSVAGGSARRDMESPPRDSSTGQPTESRNDHRSGNSEELNSANETNEANECTCAMHRESTTVDTVGASTLSGEEYASGASDSGSSDTESDEWILGVDDAQRLNSTCGRHRHASLHSSYLMHCVPCNVSPLCSLLLSQEVMFSCVPD
jgi:hypothetical protein